MVGFQKMPINASPRNEPLSEAEFDRLADFLISRGEQAMNIEELDGFFAALLAGPDMVLPSEYLPLVFGGAAAETPSFAGIDEANDILGLLMRHWNGISATLRNGDVHLPILLEDDSGVSQGTDWAHGFTRGVEMRSIGWAELLNDEEYGGCMIPVLILHHEHDDNPELRPPPIGPERREEIIVQMAAGIVRAHRYFQRRAATPFGHTARRRPGKTGRNEPCPCGSGKKHKRCCGGATIN
jgi:uncharacterized protein